MINLRLGDCLEVMREIPDDSVDACVTDPPYGWSFMGKRWDYDVPAVEVWREVYRVLKPGAHILVACGTRTQHRMAVNIEDAGFEIRDVITWLYGSGFPKSLDISKAIDREAGAAPAAMYWQGWGTALKPACEFWTLARKPLAERTVAANVLAWGTGGVNIDGCRVGIEERMYRGMSKSSKGKGVFRDDAWDAKDISVTVNGRFPANLILDEAAAALLDEQSGVSTSHATPANTEPTKAHAQVYGFAKYANMHTSGAHHGDTGGASRFFYCAKASRAERDAGCEGLPEEHIRRMSGGEYANNSGSTNSSKNGAQTRNPHPTVKPISLMRYLCRLITPPGGVVLDPFMGSGSTGIGATLEGFGFIGIELDADYHEIARRRIEHWSEQPALPVYA